jgi:phosphotriesterase-related protein
MPEASASSDLKVMTVTGEAPVDSLGAVLPHEHILVDFIGADKSGKHRYDPDEVFRAVLPYLTQARKLGLGALFECTPAYLGRDPVLLRRLSKASGVKIVTNTGLYGAAADKFLPAYAFRETAEQLAKRWTAEWEHGAEGSGIRPGFIKIGVDPEPSETDMKLAEAAALTHLRTGLTIASHTGAGKAAKLQIEALKKMGVSPAAFVWVHAHAESDAAMHIWAARQGAWPEFDGLSPSSVEQHVRLVSRMKEEGTLDRVLVSHDAGWYSVGEGAGGFRPFDTLFTQFLPALSKAGLTDGEIKQITHSNPQRAFARQVRRAE